MANLRNQVLSSIGNAAALPAESPALQQLFFNSIRLNRPEFSRLWVRDDLRFLSYAFAKRAHSRSQILQDLWVCFELEEKRNGFFVEFGATDGKTNSNTWLLESDLSWDGILAEPNPLWHPRLTANRKVAIEHKCVSSASNERVTFLTTNEFDPEVSGIAEFADGDRFAEVRQSGKTMEVETISLDDLLTKYKAPAEIDYLSIDTEGSELSILSAFDFGRHHFKVITVEQNEKTEPGLRKLLEGHGYVKVFPQFSQWDGWYVSHELAHRPSPEIVAPSA
jgi:FkbM family methyltransferase